MDIGNIKTAVMNIRVTLFPLEIFAHHLFSEIVLIIIYRYKQ